MAKLITFLGTRPEIIKLSPLIPILAQKFDHVLVHSGQQHTREMEGVFFEELRLPAADYNPKLGPDGGPRQIARMMLAFEPILHEHRPDAVLVQGGTETALAAALTAGKLGIRVAHVEAGVRTFNRRAPEEINRVLIDRLASWLFAPDEIAHEHLRAEGMSERHIFTVGSTTIDACRRNLQLAEARSTTSRLKLDAHEYIVLTLHRAENTAPETLQEIMKAINALARIWTVVFPMHPETMETLGDQHALSAGVKVINPLGYLDMLNLTRKARALLTDSSGLQEEAMVLGTPALVMRNETEWPHLVQVGANALVGNTYQSLMDRAWPLIASDTALDNMRRRAVSLPGGAAQRIVRILQSSLEAERDTALDNPTQGVDSLLPDLESSSRH